MRRGAGVGLCVGCGEDGGGFGEAGDGDEGPGFAGEGADGLFEPDHIEPAAVFVAGIVVGTERAEAELLVQGAAGIVRHGHDAVGRAHALLLQQREKDSIELRAESAPGRVAADVDRQLRVPAVGRALLRAVGVGVGQDVPVLLRDQPGIDRAVAPDAAGKLRLGRQDRLKGDGRIDILRVDGKTGRGIAGVRKSDVHDLPPAPSGHDDIDGAALVVDLHFRDAAAEFSVDGPGDRLVEFEPQRARLCGDERIVVEVQPQRAGRGQIELRQIFCRADQDHLIQAVVERDAEIPRGLEPADGGRAGHEADEHVGLLLMIAIGHAHVRGLEPAERTRAVHDVGKTAPDALVLLRGLIRHVGKDAEGRHISEEPVRPERADVQRERMPVHDLLRRPDGILGQPERGGHVVDGAAGDIAKLRPLFIRQGHETGDRLVERPVAAGADDQIVLRAARGDLARQIARAGGHMDRDLIAASGEDLQHLHERAADLRVAGVRVDEKQ